MQNWINTANLCAHIPDHKTTARNHSLLVIRQGLHLSAIDVSTDVFIQNPELSVQMTGLQIATRGSCSQKCSGSSQEEACAVFGNSLDDRRPAYIHTLVALVICLLVPATTHTISLPLAMAKYYELG
jgi:hypothetical protein